MKYQKNTVYDYDPKKIIQKQSTNMTFEGKYTMISGYVPPYVGLDLHSPGLRFQDVSSHTVWFDLLFLPPGKHGKVENGPVS